MSSFKSESFSINNETLTSQDFDFLKKISKIRLLFLRTFQKRLFEEMKKDLPSLFKKEDSNTLKIIQDKILQSLSKYIDDKLINTINDEIIQNKLSELYKLNCKYQNKSIKFSLLSANEETDLKLSAIDQIKEKKDETQSLLMKTNSLKEEKYNQLNKIFDDIIVNLSNIDSIKDSDFNKDNLFYED